MRKGWAMGVVCGLMLPVFDAAAGGAETSAKDTYNRPPEVAATLGADETLLKMETAVQPETLEAFKKGNPAPFWLFGEDRRLAVRNSIIPAHWFEGGAKQHGRFTGSVRPGEFYVFQVCVIGGDKRQEALLPKLTFKDFAGASVKAISRPAAVDPGEVKAFWLGVQIPVDAKTGEHGGMADVGGESLAVVLNVEGPPVAEAGIGEAWRLARLKWLDSSIAQSETEVTRPFTPIQVGRRNRTLDLLGRRVTLGEDGLPAQYTSYFSGSNTKILKTGREAFAAAPRLEVVKDGVALKLKPSGFKFTQQTPVAVEWEARCQADEVRFRVAGRLEFDGCLQLQMLPECAGAVALDDVRLVVPFAKGAVKYAMGLGLQGGVAPALHEWKWDVAKHQDALWLGDVNLGTMLRFKGANYRRPLINAYYAFQPLNLPESWGSGTIRLEVRDGCATLVARSGRKELSAGHSPAFNLDWYFTPFKPLDVERHFTDRYYHATAGAPEENTAELRKNGATILEIHQNRLANPYINYPYNDDSFSNLVAFVKRAHADDMRVAVYYTTRELTQNLPEFFALKSLGGEVILKRREGVGWPVTNPNGPHPWLQRHAGDDIVPAWRENLNYPGYKSTLDLAVITTPDSRWNNFYLEGLDYLVKKGGIDGLYIDDTALDRASMQRARRILDADGNTGRRVSMHSWNHYNALAAWANSSIAFMELYPYYDGLWHGEGFNANASPEYMLVEMSGLPYGLMSEMLDAPNLWHGMVFGMRTRWPWSGDPRPLWRFEKEYGLAETDFVGWFDAACPVRTDNPKVKASVFKKRGQAVIALGNWDQDTAIRLAIDCKALGLDPEKASLYAPEIGDDQSEMLFKLDDPLPLSPNGGLLLVLGEGPFAVKHPARPFEERYKDKTPLLTAEFSAPDAAWKKTVSGANEIGAKDGRLQIKARANTVAFLEREVPKGAKEFVVEVRQTTDEGKTWGPGLALIWAGGKSCRVNVRSDGVFSVAANGGEVLKGACVKGKPSTLIVRLEDGNVLIESVQRLETASKTFSRAVKIAELNGFDGAPQLMRIGKTDVRGGASDYGEPGETGEASIDALTIY